ncbi:ABC transporter substrate-binding protein [Methanocella arvoryzae]|uniref:Predicted ABC-type sulfonate transport system,periplasmic component n=1 Tax=Methanocella arvoryzae (strain DSM 22066 / NBRC 105507 / MRE50) TaxID=351160 RepID=Q0W479_METAR|nr:ABC transporter substrate-binding protein [Methanocella arvoryzae]CAJ36814.1 predicted ABC-type sulfonate transport system,periplasmic component [Methanocella arvoryzae MRE50]
MEHLRIGHLSTFYHTAFILMGRDSLTKAGIEASWTLFPTGPDLVKALSGGEIDLAYIGLPPAMIGISKGLDIRCVAGGHIEGTVLVATGKYRSAAELGSENEALAQFDGGVIGCPARGSIHDIIIRDLVARAGFDIEVRNYGWADFVLAALQDGEIEAAAGTPALAAGARRFAGGKIILPSHLLWPWNPSYGIVATGSLRDRGPTLAAFLRSHEDACELIRNDPRSAARIVARVTGIVDEAYVLECYGISPKYCASLPGPYIDSAMRFAGTLHRLGYISRLPELPEVFDTRFIDQVHPGPAHYLGGLRL